MGISKQTPPQAFVVLYGRRTKIDQTRACTLENPTCGGGRCTSANGGVVWRGMRRPERVAQLMLCSLPSSRRDTSKLPVSEVQFSTPDHCDETEMPGFITKLSNPTFGPGSLVKIIIY